MGLKPILRFWIPAPDQAEGRPFAGMTKSNLCRSAFICGSSLRVLCVLRGSILALRYLLSVSLW